MARNQQERAVIDLVINGQQARTTLKEVSLAASRARADLLKMKEADSPEVYKAKLAEYHKLLEAQRQMSSRINDTATAWQRFKKNAGEVMTGVIGGNIATAGLEMLMALIPDAISKTMKLKDSMADISKATEMTDEEVQQLNKTLKKIDTRTPTSELREMAIVGGQFGVGKNQLAGFVDSANQLNVALGDQFGSAEATATQMLTLRNTFQDIKSDKVDQDMLHIGNAINLLESQGAATGSVMSDFANRIGGVAIPLGFTSGQTLGLSATLQELGVTAERGSTAVTDLLTGMAKAPESFAKYAVGADGAKMSGKEFANLVNTDLMGAFMAVARGMKEGDASATGLAAKLDDLGLNGTGVTEVLMKLSSNTELLTTRTNQATKAIGETSSITNEYNKKNYDLAVNLKKLSEFFSGLMSSSVVQNFSAWLVNTGVSILGLRDKVADLTKAYLDQRTKVGELEKGLTPLLKRHDELKAKTVLTKDEQAELKKIVGEVANIVPSAVTEFDKYGNALAISTDKARDFVKMQKEMLKYQNKKPIEENEAELKEDEKQLAMNIAKRKSGKKKVWVNREYGGYEDMRPMSEDELRALDAENRELAQKIENRKVLLKGLKGEYLDETSKPTTPPKTGTGGKGAAGPTAAEIADAKQRAEERKRQAKQDAEELERLLGEARVRASKSEADEYEKQAIEFAKKYSRMYELAKGGEAKLKEIRDLSLVEWEGIEKKREEAEKKRQLEQQKATEEHAKKLGEKAIAYSDVNKKADLLGIDARTAKGEINEDHANQLKLETEQRYLMAELLLRQTYAMETVDVYQRMNENLAQQALQRSKTEQQAAEYTKEADRQWLAARQEAVASGIGLLKSFVKENSAVGKAILIAEKAWAVAQVVIKLQQEIAAIRLQTALLRSQAAAVPGVGAALIAGIEAAGTMKVATAKMNAGGSIAQIAASSIGSLAAKAKGGYTDIQTLYGSPSGFVDGPTIFAQGNRSYLAGEAGMEFVINNRALQVPMIADFARMLDAVQKTGNYSSLSISGSTGSSLAGGSADNSLSLAMLAEMRALRAEMSRAADTAERPIDFNYRVWEEYDGRVKEVKTTTKL